MAFVHFPQRPSTLRAEFVATEFAELELFAAAELRSPFDPEMMRELMEHVRSVLRAPGAAS